MRDFAKELAEIALEINAIKLNPRQPFTWASGYRMPIYNDNRMLLGDYRHRELVADGFEYLIKTHNLQVEVVAGTATAGIAPGTTLANHLKVPFIYVRDKAKAHGLQNRIEGILRTGQKVIVIEDLFSMGGSSFSAVQGVREAGGEVSACCSIFTYGLDESRKIFADGKCPAYSLLTYDQMLEVAILHGYVHPDEVAMLKEWRNDPLGWGEKHGFPKVEKK